MLLKPLLVCPSPPPPLRLLDSHTLSGPSLDYLQTQSSSGKQDRHPPHTTLPSFSPLSFALPLSSHPVTALSARSVHAPLSNALRFHAASPTPRQRDTRPTAHAHARAASKPKIRESVMRKSRRTAYDQNYVHLPSDFVRTATCTSAVQRRRSEYSSLSTKDRLLWMTRDVARCSYSLTIDINTVNNVQFVDSDGKVLFALHSNRSTLDIVPIGDTAAVRFLSRPFCTATDATIHIVFVIEPRWQRTSTFCANISSSLRRQGNECVKWLIRCFRYHSSHRLECPHNVCVTQNHWLRCGSLFAIRTQRRRTPSALLKHTPCIHLIVDANLRVSSLGSAAHFLRVDRLHFRNVVTS